MSTINDGGPAFPYQGDQFKNAELGMSLRDWFAGQALAGMLANPNLRPDVVFSTKSYQIADQLLAVRKAGEKGGAQL